MEGGQSDYGGRAIEKWREGSQTMEGGQSNYGGRAVGLWREGNRKMEGGQSDYGPGVVGVSGEVAATESVSVVSVGMYFW